MKISAMERGEQAGIEVSDTECLTSVCDSIFLFMSLKNKLHGKESEGMGHIWAKCLVFSSSKILRAQFLDHLNSFQLY